MASRSALQAGSRGACKRRRLFGVRRRLGWFHRQNNFRASAVIHVRVESDCPAMRSHDALHGREAQTATHELGGKKGIEDALGNLRWYPATVVNDFQPDVRTG